MDFSISILWDTNFQNFVNWFNLIGLIGLIGFLRGNIERKKPSQLFDVKRLSQAWTSSEGWVARFSILFLPFVLIYNILIWILYGCASILDFIAYIFRLIWQGLTWIWKEVLYPGVIWLLRLFWYYPIGFSWKFFQLAINLIPNSYQAAPLKSSVISLFKFSILTLLGFFIHRLFPDLKILMFLAYAIIIWQFQSAIMITSTGARKNLFNGVFPTSLINKPMLWLGVFCIVTIILFVLEFLGGFPLLFIGGLSISGAQLGLIISCVFLFAYVSALLYLPAYFANANQSINLQKFTIAIFNRLPKVIWSSPFLIFGLLLAGILPFTGGYLLNKGIKTVSHKDLQEWHTSILQSDDHIPSILTANKSKSTLDSILKEKYNDSVSLRKSGENIKAQYLNKIDVVKKYKSRIQNNQIHTFSNPAYINESQFFSIPPIPNSDSYTWQIVRAGKVILSSKIDATSNNKNSSVFYHTWKDTGTYMVSTTPNNICGSGNEISTSVRVDKIEGNFTILPFGPNNVCIGDSVKYTTAPGYSNYEWKHPYGMETSTNNYIIIEWDKIPGTMQVRAQKKNGGYTLWGGTDVQVFEKPGNVTVQVPKFLKNEDFTPSFNDRQNDYVSREDADEKIKILEYERDSRLKLIDLAITKKSAEIRQYQDQIDYQEALIWNQLDIIASKLFAIPGIALWICLVFGIPFLFMVVFNFDLYNFHQEGSHYWENSIKNLQINNPNQPLFALFITAVIAILFGFLQYL